MVKLLLSNAFSSESTNQEFQSRMKELILTDEFFGSEVSNVNPEDMFSMDWMRSLVDYLDMLDGPAVATRLSLPMYIGLRIYRYTVY